MKITETKLKGCLILEPQIFEDNRGVFFEVLKKKELSNFLGYEIDVNNKSIFIPKGMAHGFVALDNNVVFTYLCDNYYDSSMESGILYNDSDLAIDWGIDPLKLIVSDKDLNLPTFKELM